MAVVARLHQEAAGHGAEGKPGAVGSGQAAGDQQAQVLLRRENAPRVGVGIGRDDDFGEELGDFFRRGAVERAVEREHAAEGADRIAGERLPVGIGEGGAERDAAGIGVLDDRAGGRCLGSNSATSS